jgi:CubicO group peptidase (beta-lactamase class C family)
MTVTRGPADADLEALVRRRIEHLHPSFDLPLAAIGPSRVDATWDDAKVVAFETPPSAQSASFAMVLVEGETAVVAHVEASVAALSRRGAQMNETLLSIRIPGVGEEDWSTRPVHALDQATLDAFGARADALRAQASVPGMTLSLVRRDGVVLSRAFGQREFGGAAVTPRTLFMIGSTTKALTSLLGAVMVDQRELSWDEPLASVLPSFHFASAALTERAQLQHGFCACTGLPRRDFEFIFERLTPERALTILGTMDPTTGFGETFQYSNFMVMAGGYALAHRSAPTQPLDRAYRSALETRVLRPLGMRSTTVVWEDAMRREHATPNAWTLEGTMVALPARTELGISAVGPAGGLWSTAEDLARYAQLELRNGELPRGSRLLSESGLLARREPQARIDAHQSYGLGLYVGDEHGLGFLSHGGNTLGFTSELIVFPSLDVGLVVLTNGAGANALTRAITRALLEAMLDLPNVAESKLAESLATTRQALSREHDAVAPLGEADVERWLGRYSSDLLGSVEVRWQDGAPVLDAGEWSSRIAVNTHQEGRWELLDPPLATLQLEATEREGRATLVLDTPQMSYVFTHE